METEHNLYINTNPNATLVRYDISTDYIKKYRQYDIVTLDTIASDVGHSWLNKNYSYGLLTNIYHTNVFILEFDKMKRTMFYPYTGKDQALIILAKAYNNLSYNSNGHNIQIIDQLNLIKTYFVTILGDKLDRVEVYSSSTKKFGCHMYFVLNDHYDVSQLYGSLVATKLSCNGYLKFVLSSGYSNIRITNKVINGQKTNDSKITRRQI